MSLLRSTPAPQLLLGSNPWSADPAYLHSVRTPLSFLRSTNGLTPAPQLLLALLFSPLVGCHCTRHSLSPNVLDNTVPLLHSLSYHLPHICDFPLICDIIPLRVVARLRPSCPSLCTSSLAPRYATNIFSLRKSHALPFLSTLPGSPSPSCKLHIECD